MEKLELKSKDLVEKNIERLKELFPEIVTENKIDFEKLQILLGEEIEEDDERYNFTWKGKRKAIKLSQIQSTGTLRPCKEESKNWDTTENLYIEGDNLEVLRLLQEPYYNSVKMIYIDPPYNTGNDFVYKDDYKDNLAHYKEMTEQKSSNPETSGRYHTDWLNMMYPRLRLAKNILKDDGVIFISIDDNEVHNLRKICDEIFGENNFLVGGVDNRPSQIASNFVVSKHEYFLAYAKNIDKLVLNGEKRYTISRGTVGNKDQTMPVITFPSGLECKNVENGIYNKTRKIEGSKENIKNLDPIIVENGYLKKDVRLKAKWRSSNDMRNFFSNNCKPTEAKINGIIEEIYFKSDRFVPQIKKKITKKIPSLILDNKRGSKDLEDLNLNVSFDFPKSVLYIKKLISYITSDEDIILDFFSGSGTTAQAVIEKNIEDNSKRKYIMIQLPEEYEKDSEEYNAGFKNICEIGKERIRKAGEKIKKEHKNTDDLDIGFKVFKLDTSNLKVWNPVEEYEQLSIDDIKEQINDHIDILLPDRTPEDLMYEIMLKYKLKLTTPIEELNLNGKKCFNVGYGYLLLCLDKEIDKNTIKAICDYKRNLIEDIGTEDIMKRIVFIENAFTDDNLKINSIQTLKQLGIEDIKIV
jgi:adenine-specific DNA-methyltransferase